MNSRRPSAALVVSIIALCAAVMGTAVAGPIAEQSLNKRERRAIAKQIRKISAKQVRKVANTKRLRKIAAAQADGRISARAPGLSVLGAGFAANAADAAKLGGKGPSAFAQYGGTIPSGTTVAGIWGCDDDEDSAATANCIDFVSLPGKAPVALTRTTVNTAAGSAYSGDPDPGCSGSAAAPTAPRGKVCIYLTWRGFNQQNAITGGYTIDPSPGMNLYGFEVEIDAEDERAAGGGTWAYTAP